jgi:hypothetical protein
VRLDGCDLIPVKTKRWTCLWHCILRLAGFVSIKTHWMAEYQKLEKSGAAWELGVPGSGHKWEKSTTALSVFPRSQLDRAIGMEVERLNRLEFESLIQARRLSSKQASERGFE